MKVFVTDAHFKHSLAAVRALAAEGVEVHVGSHLGAPLCYYSRYTSKSYRYPNPESMKKFVRALEGIDDREGYDAILPIGNDCWFSLVTSNSESIKQKVPMPPLDSYLIACNKARTMSLAKELGIPIPETILPDENPSSRIQQMGYPLVMKPALGSENVRFFNGLNEAILFHDRVCNERNPLLIQRFVRGQAYGFFGLYNKGRLRAFFMHRRIREVPPRVGSTAAESVYSPHLFDLASKILEYLSWHGIAMVEFIKEVGTGEFKLLEINPKFWGSLDLPIVCGINFPYLAARMVVDGDVTKAKGYRLGLRYCWPIPDDLHFIRARPASCLTVVRDWIDPSVKKNIRADDLGPVFSTVATFAERRTLATVRNTAARFSIKPIRFGWVINGKLAASGKPQSLMQIIWLKKQGVRAILDLTVGPDLPERWKRFFGGKYLHAPMEDHFPPPSDTLGKAVEFISEKTAAGTPVLVYCLGGLGRTGTVLACYFMKRYEIKPEKAMIEIRSQRPGSIEISQENSIVNYFKALSESPETPSQP